MRKIIYSTFILTTGITALYFFSITKEETPLLARISTFLFVIGAYAFIALFVWFIPAGIYFIIQKIKKSKLNKTTLIAIYAITYLLVSLIMLPSLYGIKKDRNKKPITIRFRQSEPLRVSSA